MVTKVYETHVISVMKFEILQSSGDIEWLTGDCQ